MRTLTIHLSGQRLTELIRDYLDTDVLLKDIAKKYDITLSQLKGILTRLGYSGKRRRIRLFCPEEIDDVIKMYTLLNVGIVVISRKYGVSTTKIKSLLVQNGVQMRRRTKSIFCGPRDPLPNDHKTNQDIICLYSQEKLSVSEIARKFGCSKSPVLRRLDKLCVPRRSVREAAICAKDRQRRKGIIYAKEIDLSQAVDSYVCRRKTLRETASELGVGYSVIRRRMGDLGVTRSRGKEPRTGGEKSMSRKPEIVKQKRKQRLTAKESKLISESYEEIRQVIQSKFGKHKIAKFLMNSHRLTIDEVVDQIVSFAPEAAMKYESAFKVPFYIYVANKCIWLYIDQLRLESTFSRLMNYRSKEVEKIQEEVISQKGSCREDDILKKLTGRGYNQELSRKYIDAHNTCEVNFGSLEFDPEKSAKCDNDRLRYYDGLQNSLTDFQQSCDTAGWDDAKCHITRKTMSMNIGGCRWSHIARAVVVENILPQIEGKRYTTLRAIGERFKMSESRVSQIKTMTMESSEFREIVGEAIGISVMDTP